MRRFTDNSPGGTMRTMFAPAPPEVPIAIVLAPGVAKRVAIQPGAEIVAFSATAPFWMRFGDTNIVAAVPTADVLDGTASDLNPASRTIPDAATHISLVAETAAKISIGFWKA